MAHRKRKVGSMGVSGKRPRQGGVIPDCMVCHPLTGYFYCARTIIAGRSINGDIVYLANFVGLKSKMGTFISESDLVIRDLTEQRELVRDRKNHAPRWNQVEGIYEISTVLDMFEPTGVSTFYYKVLWTESSTPSWVPENDVSSASLVYDFHVGRGIGHDAAMTYAFKLDPFFDPDNERDDDNDSAIGLGGFQEIDETLRQLSEALSLPKYSEKFSTCF